MEAITDKCASLQFDVGIAPFLDEEMRVYSPLVYRGKKKRIPLARKNQHYWIVRATTNYLLEVARRSDFVLGVVVVTAQGIKLSAFTSQFELAKQVNRCNASASYTFYATRAHDKDMGDIWVVKVVKECLNEQGKPN